MHVFKVTDTPYVVVFAFAWPWFWRPVMGFGSCLALFRHADRCAFLQRFTACLRESICVDRDRAVSLSLAAAQRVARTSPGREVGEWWWFENSRAYLYYFFIVNDCQFIVRSLRVAGRP